MLVIFVAVRPATGEDFALVLPEVSTVAMAIFLEGVAGALPAHVHAVMALDQADRHGSKKLTVPNNVSLAPLPPYSPELNPAERVWLFLRERFLVLFGPRRPGSRHRCLLRRLECRRCRNRPPQITMQLPMDHKSQFIDPAV